MAALTVGARSRFNPHGEQGKKNTCQECHEKHVADLAAEAGAQGGDGAAAEGPKRIAKKRKLVPKVGRPAQPSPPADGS